MCPILPHVIRFDKLSGAFLSISAKSSKGLLPCQEFLMMVWHMGGHCPGFLSLETFVYT